ncbi:polyhydroxyalkanoic acid system family protein [Rhodocaloribacter sp.]
MAIHLERTHHLDKAAARAQVAEVVEEIAPLIKAKYHWEGDRLAFRGRGVRGAIEVDDDAVRVEVVRSPLLPVSERWLRDRIGERLAAHFPEEAPLPEPSPAPEAASPPDGTPPSHEPATGPANEADDAGTDGAPSPHEPATGPANEADDARGDEADDEDTDEVPATKLIAPLTNLAGEAARNTLRIASLASKASFHIAREILRTDDEPGPEDPEK